MWRSSFLLFASLVVPVLAVPLPGQDINGRTPAIEVQPNVIARTDRLYVDEDRSKRGISLDDGEAKRGISLDDGEAKRDIVLPKVGSKRGLGYPDDSPRQPNFRSIDRSIRHEESSKRALGTQDGGPSIDSSIRPDKPVGSLTKHDSGDLDHNTLDDGSKFGSRDLTLKNADFNRRSTIPVMTDGGYERRSTVPVITDGGHERRSTIPVITDGGHERRSTIPVMTDGGYERRSGDRKAPDGVATKRDLNSKAV